MNTKSAMLCILIIAALCLTQAVDLAHAESFDGGPGKTSASARQNDVTITCPARVVYQAQAIPGWNPGIHSMKHLAFVDANVSGRVLYCNYSATSGSDGATIMREAPAGYICTTDVQYGYKNWQFTCKRAVPPIKIKPKS